MRGQQVADLDYFELKDLDRGLVKSLQQSFAHFDARTYPLEDSVLRPLRLESELADAINLHSQAQEPHEEFLQEPVQPIILQQEPMETSSFEMLA